MISDDYQGHASAQEQARTPQVGQLNKWQGSAACASGLPPETNQTSSKRSAGARASAVEPVVRRRRVDRVSAWRLSTGSTAKAAFSTAVAAPPCSFLVASMHQHVVTAGRAPTRRPRRPRPPSRPRRRRPRRRVRGEGSRARRQRGRSGRIVSERPEVITAPRRAFVCSYNEPVTTKPPKPRPDVGTTAVFAVVLEPRPSSMP